MAHGSNGSGGGGGKGTIQPNRYTQNIKYEYEYEYDSCDVSIHPFTEANQAYIPNTSITFLLCPTDIAQVTSIHQISKFKPATPLWQTISSAKYSIYFILRFEWLLGTCFFEHKHIHLPTHTHTYTLAHRMDTSARRWRRRVRAMEWEREETLIWKVIPFSQLFNVSK